MRKESESQGMKSFTQQGFICIYGTGRLSLSLDLQDMKTEQNRDYIGTTK